LEVVSGTDGCRESTGITFIVAPDELLFDAKLYEHGVYFPFAPIGNVNDEAPVAKIFVTPLSLNTPFNKIEFDTLKVPAMAAF
jgi:hypothetical protein